MPNGPLAAPKADSTASNPSVPLWQQLQQVAAVVLAVRAGQSWTTAQLDIPATLRPGVQALSFAVLRHLGTAQALRKQIAQKAPPSPADALLCSVLALAIAGQEVRYEAYTLVDQAVEAAKRSAMTKAQAPFINACLRRFLREREALLVAVQTDLQAQWNHPVWWIKRLQADYPQQWQSILQANSTAAPLTLRINQQKTTLAGYSIDLVAMNIIAKNLPSGAVELNQTQFVPGLPGYLQGHFSVQDAAAQLAAPLLLESYKSSPQPVLRVLDACAAPGGKTAHLLEYAAVNNLKIELTALDVDAQRCLRITENLQRLDLQTNVVTADAVHTNIWWDGQPFDAILLDAPCTASGIVRRHPDIRWLRRESDVGQLAALQKRLLLALWPLLKPGGLLLYCTCSVFKAEGAQQIQTFVAHHTDAQLLPSPGHLLPQKTANPESIPDNYKGGHDGFFYALLQKK